MYASFNIYLHQRWQRLCNNRSLSVGQFVSRITQQVTGEFGWNLQGQDLAQLSGD